MSQRRRALSRITMGVAAAAMTLGMVSVADGAFASSSPATVSFKPCGQVFILAGQWLGGHGVNVRSNGTAEGTGSDCSSTMSYVGGVLAGRSWQCAELVNRLYLNRGWIDATWTGDAGSEMWKNAPDNLTKQLDGSISYLGPGDVLDINVYFQGRLMGGHVFVVNAGRRVTSGTVALVSQNNSRVPQKPGSLVGGKVSVSGAGGGWTYRVIGVIHAP